MKKLSLILTFILISALVAGCTVQIGGSVSASPPETAQISAVPSAKPSSTHSAEPSESLYIAEVTAMADEEILYTYVNGLEIVGSFDFSETSELMTNQLYTLFLYSLNNDYMTYEKRWYDADTDMYIIPVDEITEQLGTVLKSFFFNAALLDIYDSDTDTVVAPFISGFGGEILSRVAERSTDGNVLRLTVDFYEDEDFNFLMETKQYEFEFYDGGYYILKSEAVDYRDTPAVGYLGRAAEEELFNYFIKATYLGSGENFGFADPLEISTDDLFRFAGLAESDRIDAMYDAGDELYYIPLSDITEILDGYLEEYNFIPAELFHAKYDSKTGLCTTSHLGFGASAGNYALFSAQVVGWDLLEVLLSFAYEDAPVDVYIENLIVIRGKVTDDGVKFISCYITEPVG